MIQYQVSITCRTGGTTGIVFMAIRSKDELKEMQTIPGIGPSISRDLADLGYISVSSLRGEDPELMYQRLCELRGGHIDRCVLYVFRCAVYFADNTTHNPELLKWWNWKDGPDIEDSDRIGKVGASG